MALMHDIEGACAQTSLSRTTLYEEIKAGHITTVKVGRRTYITHAELERYVASLVGDAA